MKDYDGQLRGCKDRVAKVINLLIKENKSDLVHEMAGAIDDLNKGWDELTDALMRQREERDKIISNLLNELAERPK